jgi:hypothetical protein
MTSSLRGGFARWLLVIAAMSLGAAAHAGETINYTYDALGRLVQVARSGTVNNGASEGYSFDPAGNRTNVTVSTGGVCAGVTFTISTPAAVTEGASSVFTVTKAGTTSSSCTVNYATASGSATSGSDFTATSGTLTFTAAQTSQTVSVPTIDDTTVESAETFTLSLSGPNNGGALGSPSSATATINDNDTTGTCTGVSFTIASNGAVTEGATSVFTVTKAGSTSSSCSVNYATAGGTATSGSDFTAKSGTLAFSSTQTSQTVSVATIDDTAVESAETFTMSLSAPTGGSTLGSPNSANATINDNDSAGTCSGVSFSVNDTSATEASPLVFTVTKSGSSSISCSINYATADVTAVAPGDYTATSGTLTFAATDTAKTVSVTTLQNHNASPEPDETMNLNLSGATGGAAISDSQGVGTIYDDYTGGGCPTCL